jgi:hypothetical protein
MSTIGQINPRFSDPSLEPPSKIPIQHQLDSDPPLIYKKIYYIIEVRCPRGAKWEFQIYRIKQ